MAMFRVRRSKTERCGSTDYYMTYVPRLDRADCNTRELEVRVIPYADIKLVSLSLKCHSTESIKFFAKTIGKPDLFDNFKEHTDAEKIPHWHIGWYQTGTAKEDLETELIKRKGNYLFTQLCGDTVRLASDVEYSDALTALVYTFLQPWASCPSVPGLAFTPTEMETEFKAIIGEIRTFLRDSLKPTIQS